MQRSKQQIASIFERCHRYRTKNPKRTFFCCFLTTTKNKNVNPINDSYHFIRRSYVFYRRCPGGKTHNLFDFYCNASGGIDISFVSLAAAAVAAAAKAHAQRIFKNWQQQILF